jgi:hypothetical protein
MERSGDVQNILRDRIIMDRIPLSLPEWIGEDNQRRDRGKIKNANNYLTK